MKNRIIEAMDFESNYFNWKFSFDVMTKKYGKEFIDIVKVMWSINNDVQTEEEFCEMNKIPKSFFDKVIKK